jgi:hypothetical protein
LETVTYRPVRRWNRLLLPTLGAPTNAIRRGRTASSSGASGKISLGIVLI